MKSQIVDTFKAGFGGESAIEVSRQLAAENPGAYTVIRQLMWFTKWYLIIKWLLESGYVGPKLWELWKDECHESLDEFNKFLRGNAPGGYAA